MRYAFSILRRSCHLDPEAVFGRLSLTLSRLPKWRHLEIDVPLRPWDCFFLSILTLIFITRHGDRPFNIESLTIGVSMPSEPVDGAPHIRERYAHYLKTGLSIFDLSSNTLLSLRKVCLRIRYIPYAKPLPALLGSDKCTVDDLQGRDISYWFPKMATSSVIDVALEHLVED